MVKNIANPIMTVVVLITLVATTVSAPTVLTTGPTQIDVAKIKPEKNPWIGISKNPPKNLA